MHFNVTTDSMFMYCLKTLPAAAEDITLVDIYSSLFANTLLYRQELTEVSQGLICCLFSFIPGKHEIFLFLLRMVYCVLACI